MNLINNLKKELKINNKGLIVESIVDTDANEVLVIKTKNKILALGVEILDEINSSTKFGDLKSEYQKTHYNFYYDIAKSLNGINKETNEIDFILFFISENYIVHAPWTWGEWVCYEPEKRLDRFLKDILSNPELRTSEQKLKDEIDELEYRIKVQNEDSRNLQIQIDTLENSIKNHKTKQQGLEDQVRSLENNLREEKLNNSLLAKESEYYGYFFRLRTISRLTKKQIQYLKNRSENQFRIDLELFYPNMLFEYNTTTSIAWSSPSDWIQVPSTGFFLVDKNGLESNIEIEEIANNTNCKGFYGEYKTLHLIGSINISKTELE